PVSAGICSGTDLTLVSLAAPPADALQQPPLDPPGPHECRQSPARSGAGTPHHYLTTKSPSGQTAQPGHRPLPRLSPRPAPNTHPQPGATCAGPVPASWRPDYSFPPDAQPGLSGSRPGPPPQVGPVQSAPPGQSPGKIPCWATGWKVWGMTVAASGERIPVSRAPPAVAR